MKAHALTLRLFCFFFVFSLPLAAQRKNQSYVEYIQKYGEIAVQHQQKYKIPASITLAQGLLESGAGKSKFVQDSNNHFGIKCHSDWTGKRIYRSDDNPNDCFRVYKHASESFEDHSQFLLRKRYAPLFALNIKDYVGWARGLQRLGYATDKAYANKLIKLVEDYELYRYDNKGKVQEQRKEVVPNKTHHNVKQLPKQQRVSYISQGGLLYVLAGENDNYLQIASDLNMDVRQLIKYNEVPEDFPLYKGDIVYLEKKKKKADKPYFEHVVQIGESMHRISQMYGIRVKNLYKMNKKDFEYVPEEGDVLRLR